MMKKGFLCLILIYPFSCVYAMQHQTISMANSSYDVIQVEQLSKLELFLKNPQTNRYYQKFSMLQKALPTCAKLNFAMNAGMYHSDFQPVGLYIEKSKQLKEINETTGFGNFFMQPNGVVAWNSKQAIIKTTAEYKKQEFNAVYATQSGPMLVYKGKINSQFLADSTSLKIRNGVGIKDNQLYFVISQQAVNFYQFAQFFKQQLKIDNALYLDGSISSLYVADTRRNDQNFNLGPIVAEVAKTNCRD